MRGIVAAIAQQADAAPQSPPPPLLLQTLNYKTQIPNPKPQTSPAFVSLLRPIYAQLPSLVVCAEALLLCEGSHYARDVAFRQDSLVTVCSESFYSVHRRVPFRRNFYVLRSIVTASAFLMYSRDALESRTIDGAPFKRTDCAASIRPRTRLSPESWSRNIGNQSCRITRAPAGTVRHY